MKKDKARGKKSLCDPEGKNEDRALWAQSALSIYAVKTGQSMKTDKPEIFSDLLADLMHYADRNGIDFNEAFKSALGNYRAETSKNGELL